MNLGLESETLEFKKTTGELDRAMDNLASMLNKHGHGTLYFGVSPNGDVTGQNISSSSLDDVAKKIKFAIKPTIYPEIKVEVLDGKDLIRVDFSGTEKPYSSFGKYYKRVFDRTEEMTPEELKRMMAETDRQSYWENNLTKYGLESVDNETLSKFYQKAVSCGRLEPMSKYDDVELLTGLGLYDQGKLTNAGYYLFSNRKPVVLKMAVYVTDERIGFSDIQRLEGNIYSLIRDGFSYIKNHINWSVEFGSDTARIEVPEIPVEAVREILVNSFAHANYRDLTENEIDITPTRVEIYNPGEFPSGLTPEMFARQRIRSMPRNKSILNTLYKSKDVENFGAGFRKVYEICGRRQVRVDSSSGYGGFSFVFFRNALGKSPAEDGAPKNENSSEKGMNQTQALVYQYLKEDPTCTRQNLADRAGRSVRTIQRALDKLSAEGKIRRIGSPKYGYWEVF
ncbi:MAG: putative DNA binding domain-containing protein [Succinivibrionaceae bacterium]|nr:putative DNA binding domain-containing protein [Succinivibrionaceae bacterium]